MLNQTGCDLQAFIIYYIGCLTVYLFVVICYDRFFIFVFFQTTSKKYIFILLLRYCFVINLNSIAALREKKSNQKKLSVVAAGLSLFWSMAPIFGWNRYRLEVDKISCSIIWNEHSLNVISYNVSSFLCVYLLPLIAIIWTNCKILMAVSKQKAQLIKQKL